MKKLIALLLVFVTVIALVACGETGKNTDTAPSSGSDAVSSSTSSQTDKQTDENSDKNTSSEEWKPLDVVDNLVIACDQHQNRIVVYDMDLAAETGDLDKAEVWEMTGIRTASIKYRTNTVYGDVIITSSYTDGPTIIKYPSKEIVWKGGAACAGNNPHSVEILPSGNMISAASTGNTVRIYNNANVLKNGDGLKYSTYTLEGAHGLLYDPENNYVWALGGTELVAYMVVDKGDGTEELKKINGVGAKLPSPASGHDLSPDLTDSRYLWITSAKQVLRFDKEEGKFKTSYTQSNKLSKADVKGFGNNQNNNFVFCFPNNGPDREWAGTSYAEWCTDTLYFGTWKRANLLNVKEYKSSTSAFYKVHVFCGEYQ